MDGEGELFFSGPAEHLKDHEPSVEDDHPRKNAQKPSPKRALPKSTAKKFGPIPKKATKKPCPSSKQSPSKKRKIIPSVASPKKRAAPSKMNSRESPSKKEC